jgi:hypothetical protein
MAGKCELPEEIVQQLHIDDVITLTGKSIGEQQAIAEAYMLLETKSFDFINSWLLKS